METYWQQKDKTMSLFPITKHQLKISLIIVGLCLVLHVAVTLFYPVTYIAEGDGIAYIDFAKNLAKGRGFFSDLEPWVADRPPLYPFFLSFVIRLFGVNRLVIYLVQAEIFAMAAGLFYLCVCRLLGPRHGLIGGLIFALLPHFVLYTNNVLTEAFYVSYYVFLMAWILLPKRLKIWHCVAAGITLGFYILLRREGIMVGGVLILGLLLIRFWTNWRRILLAFLTVLIMSVFIVLPWIIRNWTLLGKPVLSSATGLNLMVCNNPLANGGYTLPPEDWPKPNPPLVLMETDAQYDQELPCYKDYGFEADIGGQLYRCYFMIELEYNQTLKNKVFSWIRENPGAILPLIGKKTAVLLGPANNRLLDILDLLLVPFYAMGIVQLFLKKENWKKIVFTFVLVFFVQLLINMIFCGGYRYRIIFYPGLILMAVFSLPPAWLAFIAKLPVLRFLMKESSVEE